MGHLGRPDRSLGGGRQRAVGELGRLGRLDRVAGCWVAASGPIGGWDWLGRLDGVVGVAGEFGGKVLGGAGFGES
jgi:hypothetical protein